MTTEKDKLPPLEDMLSDLAKVPGLEGFWSAFSLAAQIGLLNPGELRIVESKTPGIDAGFGEGEDA
jgi:hypothetical protein